MTGWLTRVGAAVALAAAVWAAPGLAQSPELTQRFEAELAQARVDWRAGGSQAQRFDAAYRRAGALAGLRRWIPSDLWLRVAGALAPTAATQDLVTQSNRLLRRASPVRLRASVQAAPSNNLNNGSSSDTIDTAFGTLDLPGEDQALSGLRYGGSVDLQYRVARSDTATRWVTAGLAASGVRLSQEAKTLAPTARNGDYAQARLTGGVSGVRLVSPTRRDSWAADITHLRLAGDPFETKIGGRWTTARAVEAGQTVELSLTGHAAARPSGEDHRRLSGALSHQRQLQAGALRFGVSTARSDSEAAYLDYSELRLSTGWQPRTPALWHPELALSMQRRWHPTNIYTQAPRHDRRWSLAVSAPLPGAQPLGLTPVVSLQASRTFSNVSVYRTESFGVSLALRGQF